MTTTTETGKVPVSVLLKLLKAAGEYRIAEASDDANADSYSVIDDKHGLEAIVGPNGIECYVTGVYNSGSDYARIDLPALDALRGFCASLFCASPEM